MQEDTGPSEPEGLSWAVAPGLGCGNGTEVDSGAAGGWMEVKGKERVARGWGRGMGSYCFLF